MSLYLLFETAGGYALFERREGEEIGASTEEMQAAVQQYNRFSKTIEFKAFLPFTSAENALENINMVSEGLLPKTLRDFLELELPKAKKDKKAKFQLGVLDPKLGGAIQEELNVPVTASDPVPELLRGIRLHFTSFVKDLDDSDLRKAQLGLGHSYSRAKVKFNVNRADNMIIQAISLLDQLDKDINTFAMRVKEWYSWHFPELQKIVNDNHTFCRLAVYIKNKEDLDASKLEDLEEITQDAGIANQIIEAAKTSMGLEVSEFDMANIEHFAARVAGLAEYRKKLHEYLVNKMHTIAPNLATLIGEQVGARLISHAGSLTNLAKYPASTVQILGAEKALFRALKTRGNTPKYGLIYHSTFIGRASQKNKGRISRYLANKCSIASRIDCFSENATDKFGAELRAQVEERLRFYDTGAKPRKNMDVMKGVIDEIGTSPTKGKRSADGNGEETPKKKSKKDKKKDEDGEVEAKKEKKEKKEKKKEKKAKAESDSD